jgi:hypothetical protein
MRHTPQSAFARRSIAVLALTSSFAGCSATGDEELGAKGSAAPQDPKKADGTQPGGSIAVAAKPLVRLSNAQYANTVADVLGFTDALALTQEAADDHYVAAAAAQSPSGTQADAYARAAATIASKVSGDTTRRGALLGCEPKAAATDACLTGFANKITTRLYRRPLPTEELAAHVAAAVTGASDGWAAVRTVLEIALQSPRFLYRTNVTVAGEERSGVHRLDSYSIASNLAFLITNRGPEDKTLELAASDNLATPKEIAEEALRLLAKAEGRGLAEFYRQWLALDALLGRTRDSATYPKYTPELIRSMEREVALTAADLAGSKRPFLDLLNVDFTYVDSRLATFYGVSAPGAGADKFVRIPAPDGRVGLAAKAGFLSNISSNISSSPTQRGNFIFKRILCQDVGPAIMSMEKEANADTGPKTTRQRIEEVHAAGACQGCHKMMDGIGFGLEAFDGLGQRRTKENGIAIDNSGTLILGSKMTSFKGEGELAQALRAATETDECLVRNAVRWSLGRKLSEQELPGALAVTQSLSDRSLPAIVVAIVQSDFFRLQPTENP